MAITFDTVTAAALKLPGVVLGTSYGTPALKAGKTVLVRLRPDGDLVLRVEDGLREALIDLQPEVFHITPHYDGYPLLLVCPAIADLEQIVGLIQRALAVVTHGGIFNDA